VARAIGAVAYFALFRHVNEQAIVPSSQAGAHHQ
jgi:hypothetical protein